MSRFSKYFFIGLILAGIALSCSTPRDCKGRKKRAKTSMGGWM